MPIVVMVALVSSVVMGVLTLAGTKNYDLRSQAAYPLYQACVVNSDCQSNVCRTCRAGEVCPDVIGKFCFSPDPTKIVSTVTPTCVRSGNQQGTGQCCSGVSSVTDKAGVRWCGAAPLPTKVPDSRKQLFVNQGCTPGDPENVCPPGTLCMNDPNSTDGNMQTKCISSEGTSSLCSYTSVRGEVLSMQVGAYATSNDGKCYHCGLRGAPSIVSDTACVQPTDPRTSCYEQGDVKQLSSVPCCAGLGVKRTANGEVCDVVDTSEECYAAGERMVDFSIPCCNHEAPDHNSDGTITICGPTDIRRCPFVSTDGKLEYVQVGVCRGSQRCQENERMETDVTCGTSPIAKPCYSGLLCADVTFVNRSESCPVGTFDSYDACKSEGAKTGSPKVQSTTSSLNTETTKVAANVSQKYGITVDVSQNKTMLPDTVKTLDTTLDKLPQSFVVQAKNITFVDGQQKSSSNDLKGNIVVSCDPTKAIECQENVVHLIAIGSTEKPVVTSTCKDGCSALDAFHKVITANKLLSVNSQGVIDPTSSKLQLPSKLAPTEKEAFAYYQAKAILDPKALSSESSELAKLFAEMGK